MVACIPLDNYFTFEFFLFFSLPFNKLLMLKYYSKTFFSPLLIFPTSGPSLITYKARDFLNGSFQRVKNKKHHLIAGRKFYRVGSHILPLYVAYRVGDQNYAANICFGVKSTRKRKYKLNV